MRLFFTRRWLVFAVVVALLAWLAWWLGEWQFHRLDDRQARNAVIERNYDAAPRALGELVQPGDEVADSAEWSHVTAEGEYLPDETIVVRYRSRESTSGIEVVVPLRTDSGAVVLVDRGWLRSDTATPDRATIPQPPAGRVVVTGWLRADATGSSTDVTDDLSTRAISSRAIATAIGRPAYGGFVVLDSESPEPADNPLLAMERPETGSGPHFFYGLQWWFFGALAIFGFCYLFVDELRLSGGHRSRRRTLEREAQSARNNPPSTGTITPETYDAAGDSTKAATRPNSSGSP